MLAKWRRGRRGDGKSSKLSSRVHSPNVVHKHNKSGLSLHAATVTHILGHVYTCAVVPDEREIPRRGEVERSRDVRVHGAVKARITHTFWMIRVSQMPETKGCGVTLCSLILELLILRHG